MQEKQTNKHFATKRFVAGIAAFTMVCSGVSTAAIAQNVQGGGLTR